MLDSMCESRFAAVFRLRFLPRFESLSRYFAAFSRASLALARALKGELFIVS